MSNCKTQGHVFGERGVCMFCGASNPELQTSTMSQRYAAHRERLNQEGGTLEHDLLRSIGIERVEVLVSVTFADGSSYVERWNEKDGAVGEARGKA